MTRSKRAAVYCRISRDKAGGGLGVARQENDCRALAKKLGARVIAVHTDNDISAYSGKSRPGYRALLQAVRSGAVDVVLVWHTDRLHRSPVELEEWIAAAEVHGVTVHGVKAGELDLATPSGRMVARQLGAVARYESEHRAERVRSQKVDAATRGEWRGGRRPFGYERDGVTVRQAEADVVADLTDRALAGESIHSLARDLNARGILTSTGQAWKPPEVRGMLRRARNAGLVESNGDVIGPARWDAIVDQAKWSSLRRLVDAPDRRRPRSAEEVWLGSGLYRCGRCGDGTTMRSASTRTSHRGGGQSPAYRCRTGSHLTRIAAPLDKFVTDVVLRRLSEPDARLLLAQEGRRVDVEALHAERADLDARLTELGSMFARRTITGPAMEAATVELRAEVERVDAALADATSTSPLSGFADADDVRVAWEAATVGRRKAVVDFLMEVTLLPARKGRPPGWVAGDGYFDPAGVRIDWRRRQR